MQKWISAVDGLLTAAARNPSGPLEKWSIVGIALFLMVLVFGKLCQSSHVPNTDPARSWITILVGMLLVSLGAVLVAEFAPEFGGAAIKHWIRPVLGAVVTWLVVVLPLTALWQRSKYMDAFVPWTAALVAGVIAVFLLSGIFDAVASGKKSASIGVRRNKEIKEKLF